MTEAPEACPHCGSPMHGYRGAVCPWCSRRVDAAPGSLAPGVVGKRLLVLAGTGGALFGWFLFVPWASWTLTTGAIFGAIAVVLLFVSWVISGELIEA